MGCNCKEKATKNKKEEIAPLEVEMVQELKVVDTLEEINIIENMLSDINSNSEKRMVIVDFMNRYFGDNIINYCDQVCQKRLRERIAKLKQQLKG